MNTLSLLFYLGMVFGKLGVIMVLGMLFCVVIMIIGFIFWLDPDNCSSGESIAAGKLLMKRSSITLPVLLFIFVFIPGETTFNRIIASEVAERVITNEEVQKTVINPSAKYFSLWLEKQTKELQDELKK